MTSADFLQLDFPADVWFGGVRYESAEHALTTALAASDANRPQVVLGVLRAKFDQNSELADRLIDLTPAQLRSTHLAPDHDLWSAADIEAALLQVREETAGLEVMRAGMILAAHGSLVLMGRDSDLGGDLVDSAQRVGLEIDPPVDEPSLTALEDAMAEAFATRWGPVSADLFELGKTVLLYLSMEGLTDDSEEYEQARAEAHRVMQESAERLELGDRLWTILEEHGSDPGEINAILKKIVLHAVGRRP